LGITFEDERDQALAYVRRHHLYFPALADDRDNDPRLPGDGVARAYGLSGVPDSFLINRLGEIVWLRRYELTPAFLHRTLPRLIAANS
jgi:hypothetical protein